MIDLATIRARNEARKQLKGLGTKSQFMLDFIADVDVLLTEVERLMVEVKNLTNRLDEELEQPPAVARG